MRDAEVWPRPAAGLPAAARILPDPLEVRVRRVAGVPLVAVRVWLRGGGRLEPAPGVAWAAGRLLVEGSATRDWRRIATEAEDRGASVWGFGGYEVIGVGVDALAEDVDEALGWALELAFTPRFPADRVEWVGRQGRTELAALRDQPEVRTGYAFREHLYAPSPRARPAPGTDAGLRALRTEACAAFHAASWGRGVVVAVAGQVDPERVEARVRAGVPRPPAEPPPVPAVEPVGIPLARREVAAGTTRQGYLYLGALTVPRFHPDYLPLEVLGVVLGAGAGLSGRLPQRLRETEGLGYSVAVATISLAASDPGHLSVYCGTAPTSVARAELAAREELARVVAEGVTEDEVTQAVAYLAGREPFRRETARQWADLLAEAAYWGAPLDDLDWRRARLALVDREAVEAVARRYLADDRLKVTVGRPGAPGRGAGRG